jgi:hypothetical protein
MLKRTTFAVLAFSAQIKLAKPSRKIDILDNIAAWWEHVRKVTILPMLTTPLEKETASGLCHPSRRINILDNIAACWEHVRKVTILPMLTAPLEKETASGLCHHCNYGSDPLNYMKQQAKWIFNIKLFVLLCHCFDVWLTNLPDPLIGARRLFFWVSTGSIHTVRRNLH